MWFCQYPLHVFCPLQRLYKSGKDDDMHKYTLHSDNPDFVRAKINAQQISDVRPSSAASHTPKHKQIIQNPHKKMPISLWDVF